MNKIVLTESEKGHLKSGIFFLSLFGTAVGICTYFLLLSLVNLQRNDNWEIGIALLLFILVVIWFACPLPSFRRGVAVGALSPCIVIFGLIINSRWLAFGAFVGMLVFILAMGFILVGILTFLPKLFKKLDSTSIFYRFFKFFYFVICVSLLGAFLVAFSMFSNFQGLSPKVIPLGGALFVSCYALCALSCYLLRKIES